jgi:NADH:ubiquinone oxidoreductase subunit E
MIVISRTAECSPNRTEDKRMSEEVKTCACGCAEEPTEEELLERLDAVIGEYRGKPGALIPVLQLAQGIFGYLPEVALKHIAREMRKPYSEVAGVVGFYSFFTTVPRGKHTIRVCLGTACYVRGGKQVLEKFERELGIGTKGTTEDRQFSLEINRCVGACGLAPVVTVGPDIYRRVKEDKIPQIIGKYRNGEAGK